MMFKKRISANQKKIISMFRKLGFSVFATQALRHGFPDLVVGKKGKNFLIQTKNIGETLSPREHEFFELWKGTVHVISCEEDVLLFFEKIINA